MCADIRAIIDLLKKEVVPIEVRAGHGILQCNTDGGSNFQHFSALYIPVRYSFSLFRDRYQYSGGFCFEFDININILVACVSNSRSISIFWLSKFRVRYQYEYFGGLSFEFNININILLASASNSIPISIFW